MKIKQVFFADSSEKPEKVKDDLVRGQDAFERLAKVLAKKVRERVSAEDYDNPSWAYKQADRNGYERAIKEVLDLINLDERT